MSTGDLEYEPIWMLFDDVEDGHVTKFQNQMKPSAPSKDLNQLKKIRVAQVLRREILMLKSENTHLLCKGKYHLPPNLFLKFQLLC